jgi:hypothetical protein
MKPRNYLGHNTFSEQKIITTLTRHAVYHGLRTPNEGINQRYLKNWANVAVKICFGRT